MALSDISEAAPQCSVDVRTRRSKYTAVCLHRFRNAPPGCLAVAADGTVFTGCNVENSSYGLTICAERAAVFAAVAAGQQTLEMIAIATAGGATPCGACRQVLAEFNPALPILLIDVDRRHAIAEANLRELLPSAFAFRPFSEGS